MQHFTEHKGCSARRHRAACMGEHVTLTLTGEEEDDPLSSALGLDKGLTLTGGGSGLL